MIFTPGQSITWRHEMRGGYGFAENIPGQVVRVTGQRVVIRVPLRDGREVERTVRVEKLKIREE